MLGYNDILQIPERCLLNKRLTKAFFLKNFDLSATEKKLLNGTIQNMEWMACIKTSNSNITTVINPNYVYEEIQVMICSLADNQLEVNGKNCLELFQKYIPYQMLVIVEDDTHFILNATDKRVNQHDKNKRTIETYFTSTPLSKLYTNEISTSFYEALKFETTDKTNMETLYKSYIQALVQFQTATITGNFKKRTKTRTEEDLIDILAIESIEKEIKSLSSKIKKESQISERVNLNVNIQNKRKKIQNIKNKLTKNEH